MMLPTLKDLSTQISDLFVKTSAKEQTLPVWLAERHDGKRRLSEAMQPAHRDWLEAIDFQPKSGQWAPLPGKDGLAGVVVGADDRSGPETAPLFAGSLPSILPQGAYQLEWEGVDAQLSAIAWALGHYSFSHYQAARDSGLKKLRLGKGAKLQEVVTIAAAHWLGRDLINIPANDLGPEELEHAARSVAAHFGADFSAIVGDDLLAENFPLIHTVGRASARTPRLIDLHWGDEAAPKVTIVGKGICFDTGGLNIKPRQGMALMKKDMGGSATALALAAMIMGANLPVRLRLLIAAAENSISGNAFRPSDVLKSRAGHTVEVGDTDAEGRLVLADALALADEEAPDHLFSFATLTGSARVGLGPDLPPVYSTDSAEAARIAEIGERLGDPCWPMPFWKPYDPLLDGRVGDVSSIAPDPFAGSIIAALFLKRFVTDARSYTHFDIYGWTPRPQPGKPVGGEPQCARAVFDYLKRTFPKS